MSAAPEEPRRALAGDLAGLVSLWTLVTGHHASLDPLFTLRPDAQPEIERMLRSQLRDPDAAVFVVGAPAAPTGFCCVRIDRAPPILAETRRAEITDLGVRSASRRRGLGSELVAAAFGWIRSRDIERVEIRVAVRNVEGQAFWRAQGFDDLMDVLQRRL